MLVHGSPLQIEFALQAGEVSHLLLVDDLQREVLPHVPDAWIDHAKTQIGYEVSFTRHFYKPTPLRSLDEIKADLEALQDEAEGLLDEIVAPAGGKA